MELEFSETQIELRDNVRDVLADQAPVKLARAVVEDGTSPTTLWATMVELGWPGLLIDESHGGVGLSFVEAGIVAEELGRTIAPGPWLATVTQFGTVVAECADTDQQDQWLGAVARGELVGALAIAEPGSSFDPADIDTTVEIRGKSATVRGSKRFVLADDPDEVVIVARTPGTVGDDGLSAVLVSGNDLCLEPLDSVDGSRRVCSVALDVTVPAERVLGPLGGAARGVRRALEAATVAAALEMIGTCQTIFDVTLAYAKEREQFGVPIGSFQAVKHKLADAFVALERARATAYFAALTIAEDDDRRSLAASVAKVAAGDCQRVLAKEGIQLHGGIGFTWEHDMHLYVKRLKATEPMFGGAGWHRRRIAHSLLD